MSAASAHRSGLSRSGAWRLVVTWILLFAFALQSYVTQTHVHGAPALAERAPMVEVVGQSVHDGASPAHDEAIACPFCQAIAVAGAFFSPAGAALGALVVRAQAASLPPIAVGLVIAPAGFSWRSRAPPQH